MNIKKLDVPRNPGIEILRDKFGAVQVNKKVNFYDKIQNEFSDNHSKILEDTDFRLDMCHNLILASSSFSGRNTPSAIRTPRTDLERSMQ